MTGQAHDERALGGKRGKPRRRRRDEVEDVLDQGERDTVDRDRQVRERKTGPLHDRKLLLTAAALVCATSLLRLYRRQSEEGMSVQGHARGRR